MRIDFIKKTIGVAIVIMLCGLPALSLAQDKSTNNLDIIHEKLKADNKLIVAKYMELTESEGKQFWPVYEEYHKDLQKLNERLRSLLRVMARNTKTIRSAMIRQRSCLMSGSPLTRIRPAIARPMRKRF